MSKHKLLNTLLSVTLFLCAWSYLVLLYAASPEKLAQASYMTEIFRQDKEYYQKILKDQEWPDSKYAAKEYGDKITQISLGLDAPGGEDAPSLGQERINAALEENIGAFWIDHSAVVEGNLSSLFEERGAQSLLDLQSQEDRVRCELYSYRQNHAVASNLSVGVLNTGTAEMQKDVAHQEQLIKEQLLGLLAKFKNQGVTEFYSKFTQG